MSNQLIQSAYKTLSGYTPLSGDCGRLCNSACCTSEGAMLLFPYEYDLVKEQNYEFTKQNLKGFGDVYAMTCNGTCDRAFRPLSCRIFPLAPKMIQGKLYVQLDARGRSVCQLTHQSILSLNEEFIIAVKKTLIMLSEDDTITRCLSAMSELVDLYKRKIL